MQQGWGEARGSQRRAARACRVIPRLAHLGPDEQLPARLLDGRPERLCALPLQLDEGDGGPREQAAPELQCTPAGADTSAI